MKIQDKLLLIALAGLTIVDFLIYILWLPDFHWLLALIPMNILHSIVLIKKPQNITSPHKLVGTYYLIFTGLKVVTFGTSYIWLLEYLISISIGIVAIYSHYINKIKLNANSKKTTKKERFKIGLFVLIIGLFLLTNYGYENKITIENTELIGGKITELEKMQTRNSQDGWRIRLANNEFKFKIVPNLYQCCLEQGSFQNEIGIGSQIQLRVIKENKLSFFDRLNYWLNFRTIMAIESNGKVYLDLNSSYNQFKFTNFWFAILGLISIIIGIVILFLTKKPNYFREKNR